MNNEGFLIMFDFYNVAREVLEAQGLGVIYY